MSETFHAPSPASEASRLAPNGGTERPESGAQSMPQRTAAPLAGAPANAEQIAIPRGGSFKGLLAFSGEASVLGELHGNIRATGRLRIGPDARVDARIEADEVVIEGLVHGDIFARLRVELTSSAVVEGAIQSPRLELHEGSRFTGRCQSGDLSETLDLPAQAADSRPAAP